MALRTTRSPMECRVTTPGARWCCELLYVERSSRRTRPMQHTIVKSALVTTVAVWAAAAGLGCDRSCAYSLLCEETDPSCPEDPADGPVADECGVWVTASWGNDG